MANENSSSALGGDATPAPQSGLRRFFSSRWHGRVPLPALFWRDMVIIGTGLNLLTGMAGLILFAAGVHAAIAIAVHFSLVPWNLFLFLAVWRTADKADPPSATIVKLGAALWLLVVIAI